MIVLEWNKSKWKKPTTTTTTEQKKKEREDEFNAAFSVCRVKHTQCYTILYTPHSNRCTMKKLYVKLTRFVDAQTTLTATTAATNIDEQNK